VIDKPIVVIGGGIAGLTVAKTLAANGMRCAIVERRLSLGGHVREWACMATDRCMICSCCSVDDLVNDVSSSDKIEVLTGWEPASVTFSESAARQILLRQIATGKERPAAAAAVVMATGFEPYNADNKVLLGHGRLDGVCTLVEVDALIRQDTLSRFTGGRSDLSVAFFQCVGSRDANSGANYCSQYCCRAALRMALKLLHELPGINVTVFYIDLQLAGKFSGELLKRVVDKNVRLCQGVPGEILASEEGLDVIVESRGQNRREHYDRIILSIGQRPGPSTSPFEQLGLSRNEFGFIASKGVLDSSRTKVPGVYVAGTCAEPKDIQNTLEHAGRTAQAIMADMRKGRYDG
jgi:heterodisulfide reductase subunit A2